MIMIHYNCIYSNSKHDEFLDLARFMNIYRHNYLFWGTPLWESKCQWNWKKAIAPLFMV